MLLWLLRIAYITLLIGMAVVSISFFVEPEGSVGVVLAPLGILAFGAIVLFYRPA